MTEQEQPEQPVTETTPVEKPAASPPKGRSWKLPGLILLLVVVAVGAFFVGRVVPSGSKQQADQTSSPAVKASLSGKYLDAAQLVSPAPEFFADYRKLFGEDCNGIPNAAVDDSRCPDQVKPSQVKYYRLGTTAQGQAVIMADPGLTGFDAQRFIAIQTATNQYKILGKLSSLPSDSASLASFAASLSKNTTLDTTADLPDLRLPSGFTFQGVDYTSPYVPTNGSYIGYPMENGLKDIRGYSYASGPYQAIKKLGTVGAYDVYQVTVQSADSFAVKETYLTVGGVFAGSYVFSSAQKISSSTPPVISWTDSTSNKDSFSAHPPGCGSASGYIVANGLDASSLTKVGTGPDSQALYQLPTDSALFQKLYKEDYGDGQYLNDDSLKNLSADQVQAKHLAFVEKQGSELVVYLNGNLIYEGGCAKPVIYLYPQQTTMVNVAVGAKVTKSDPSYGVSGWRGVQASPNGTLKLNGQSYPNLFWEGTGLGEYPIITTGTVVASSNAVATIRQQLTEQGLTSNEINDFVAYWQPKLPQTPYVRLSWLTKPQIDELAPLSITPKPTTVIRVFLDFQGLNQPISMPAPHFSAPARTGFTAVEWGGLDRAAK